MISHDLAVVQRLVDRVLVMSAGAVVETGPVDRVLTTPEHAVTRALVAAVPRMNRAGRCPQAVLPAPALDAPAQLS